MRARPRFDSAAFCHDDSGLAAIEYVIMTCIMGLMLIPTAAYLASTIQSNYDIMAGWF